MGALRCSNRINAILVLAQKWRGFFCPLSGHTDLFGRCRLEIGFHFLPFFECTHSSGCCHSECREPGKADTRLANGPRVDNCQLFLHFIGIYLKASKVPPKETNPKLALPCWKCQQPCMKGCVQGSTAKLGVFVVCNLYFPSSEQAHSYCWEIMSIMYIRM